MENDKKVILKSKGSNSAYIMNDNLLLVSPLKVPKGSVCESFIDIVSKSNNNSILKRVHVVWETLYSGALPTWIMPVQQ